MESRRIVEVIQGKRSSEERKPLRKRVAAYCRVSTDKEEQQSSLETQMNSFQSLINARGDWELAGIYADEGLSGTRAANRVEFQRMIADCEAGQIDYIVTKSISRFARNTVECLQYVRKLKDIGIYIYFEKERLDTSNTSSEMLLSILAAVAQEESHSISENLKWGYRKRFQIGIPKWPPTYGYRFQDGKVNEYATEARAVKRIFELYVSGRSLPQIDRVLQQEGYPPPGGKKWWPKTLATILHNEKYMGDVMMQKSYTVDHLSHKKVQNDQTVAQLLRPRSS
jgi:DNA invertase Pin-like site-specific DNA recombinase